jgi:polyferredoxin
VRKTLNRRTDVDVSQRLRLAAQLAFLALNVWIGVQFYTWVRFLESGGASRAASRPPGVDGWLPIAALMNLKAFVMMQRVPPIHAAGMFLLIAFLAISLLLKKAFCSWLCPVGTISEFLWKLGRRVFGRNLALPRWLDLPLRSIKYLLFFFFGWAIARMPVDEIAAFMQSPYGLIADVKLLNFFRFIGTTGLTVIGVIALLSVFVQNFWCRYLCPYGALLGLTSLLSPVTIRRDPEACIDCAKCAKACPWRLPVDTLPSVRSAECTLCMQCTAVCPARGALEVKVGQRLPLPAWSVAAAIAFIFLAVVAVARLSGHWRPNVPPEVYQPLVTNAEGVSHPMPGRSDEAVQ